MVTQTRNQTTTSILLITGLLVSGAFFAASWFGLFGSVHTNTTVDTVPSPRQLHQQFLDVSLQFLKTTPSQRSSLLPSLKRAAQQREQAMKQLAQTNPHEFLQFALMKTDRESLPEDIQPLVEQEKVIEGKLSLIHQDDFKQQKSKDEYFVNDSPAQTRILFTTAPDNHVLGATVTVSGYQLDTTFVAADPDQSLHIVQPAPILTTTQTSTTVTQTYKVAVILINFPNDARQVVTPAYAQQAIYGLGARQGVAGLYQESSFGQMLLTGKNNAGGVPGGGDVYGYVTIPDNNGSCQYSLYDNDAKQILGSALDGYDRYVFVWADGSCRFGGIAGSGGSTEVAVNMDPSGAGGLTSLIPVTTHELGHTFGLSHAGATICSPSCSWSEYADPLDPMGFRNSYNFQVGNKQALGWLTSNDVGTIANSGTYTLTPLEQGASPSGKRGWFFQTVGPRYYLEYRQPSGWDNFPAGSWEVSGVILHKLTLGSSSDFIDTNPGTTTLYDGPLTPGQTYTDAVNGVAFSVPLGGLTSAAATVNATVICAPANPVVAMSTNTIWAQPGSTLTYTLTMRNQDSAGCGSSSLTATIVPPAGWTATPSSVTATVSPLGGTNGAGAQGQITVPTTMADGNYPITFSVTNSSSGKTTSGTNYIYIDTQKPVVTIVQPANVQLPQTGTVTIQANGSDPSRSFNVRTMTIATDGVVRKTCITSMFQTCSYSWLMQGLVRGLHTIISSATDNAGNIGTSQLLVCYPFNPDGSLGTCSSGGGSGRKIPGT